MALFCEIWYSDGPGGGVQRRRSPNYINWVYFGQIIVKSTQFDQNWVLFFRKWYTDGREIRQKVGIVKVRFSRSGRHIHIKVHSISSKILLLLQSFPLFIRFLQWISFIGSAWGTGASFRAPGGPGGHSLKIRDGYVRSHWPPFSNLLSLNDPLFIFHILISPNDPHFQNAVSLMTPL